MGIFQVREKSPEQSVAGSAEELFAASDAGAILRTPARFTERLVIMSLHENEKRLVSRRALLKSMGLAPLLLRPAPFYGSSSLIGLRNVLPSRDPASPFIDIRLTPHYPARSPLADVLRLVAQVRMSTLPRSMPLKSSPSSNNAATPSRHRFVTIRPWRSRWIP